MLVFAHRGYAGRYPENTLLSFEKAIAAGADSIELDVTVSKDGQLLVVHDDTLNRTSSGGGFVGHQLAGDIQRFDAGSWKHPRYNQERIPSLSEVLKLCAGRVGVNIEIKPYFPLHLIDALKSALKSALVEIDSLAMRQDILFSCINFFVLEMLRDLDGDIRIGLVYRSPITDYDPVHACELVNAWSVNPFYKQIDAAFVQRLHQHGRKVIPFTINSPAALKKVVSWGVDGVFTDWPGRIIRLRDSVEERV